MIYENRLRLHTRTIQTCSEVLIAAGPETGRAIFKYYILRLQTGCRQSTASALNSPSQLLIIIFILEYNLLQDFEHGAGKSGSVHPPT